MKRNKPSISVIMPVYNGEFFLKQALDSVLAQTCKNFELIVINDSSTDRTSEILGKYKSDKRVKIIENKSNKGIAESLNKGIFASKGQYITRMDGDDVMRVDRLEKQIDFMERNIGVVACGTFMREIDEKGEMISVRKLPTKHKQIYKMMAYMMGMQHPTLMVDKNKLPKNFDWYKNISTAEDLDLLFRLVSFGEFANIPEYLHDYRVHENNESLRKIRTTFDRAMAVRQNAIREYGYKPGFVGILMQKLSKLAIIILPGNLVYKFYQRIRRS